VIVKSFRLYSPPAAPKPTRFASDYSPADAARFREAFLPIAKRWRLHRGLFVAFLFAFFACVGGGILFGGWMFPSLISSAFPWVISLAFFAWLVAIGADLTKPFLICPACGGNLDDIQRFCQECGHQLLERCQCSSCEKTLRNRKRQPKNYQVRACTHCGVILTETGL
jgi:hypothetical protein